MCPTRFELIANWYAVRVSCPTSHLISTRIPVSTTLGPISAYIDPDHASANTRRQCNKLRTDTSSETNAVNALSILALSIVPNNAAQTSPTSLHTLRNQKLPCCPGGFLVDIVHAAGRIYYPRLSLQYPSRHSKSWTLKININMYIYIYSRWIHIMCICMY